MLMSEGSTWGEVVPERVLAFSFIVKGVGVNRVYASNAEPMQEYLEVNDRPKKFENKENMYEK